MQGKSPCETEHGKISERQRERERKKLPRKNAGKMLLPWRRIERGENPSEGVEGKNSLRESSRKKGRAKERSEKDTAKNGREKPL